MIKIRWMAAFVFGEEEALLFAAGISFLICTMTMVLTWQALEKRGTVVERIRRVE